MARKSKLIPKKIAGFRVPKKLRRSKLLRGLLTSTKGREVLASALVAGAAAAAAALASRIDEQLKDGSRKARRGFVANALHDGAGAMMQVVTGAARSMLGDVPEPAGPAGAKPGQRADKPRPETSSH